eukprot:CAMPEP_0179214600 /NCGR_PEP_ID=MMETSP0797-20121207/2408_1 /TAXON_ID=47934 /ORGANISM="Dinophysis acuminata, Strain DAEP01" /LENGTH=100 /DNA_ID=CAMNT_0020920655 /DNA_START=389 /DNA_END=689 /DNA_ORIENTATION=-
MALVCTTPPCCKKRREIGVADTSGAHPSVHSLTPVQRDREGQQHGPVVGGTAGLKPPSQRILVPPAHRGHLGVQDAHQLVERGGAFGELLPEPRRDPPLS